MPSLTGSTSYVRDTTNSFASKAGAAGVADEFQAGQSANVQKQGLPPSDGGPQPSQDEMPLKKDIEDARPILPLAAFYMGDLRDGLPMVSLQLFSLLLLKLPPCLAERVV